MTRSQYEIHTVMFEADSLLIGYMEIPTDVRVGGQVVLQRQIRCSLGHPDYAEDAANLTDRVKKILANVLEDFADSDPYVPEDPADENDELGMGEDRLPMAE